MTILEVDRTRLEGLIVLFEYVVTKGEMPTFFIYMFYCVSLIICTFFQLPVDGNNNM